MVKKNAKPIVPDDFPELLTIVWNRDPSRPIAPQEAFELYERNWRHVDADNLTREEAQRIEELTQKFGQGYRLFT